LLRKTLEASVRLPHAFLHHKDASLNAQARTSPVRGDVSPAFQRQC
jgi:hypothetical protein